MEDPVSVRAMVHGRVQGVFFRTFVEEHAQRLGLVGYVRNLPSGAVEQDATGHRSTVQANFPHIEQDAVEVVAEGEQEHVNKLLELLRIGSPTSKVDRVETNWSEYTGAYSGFRIRY